MGKETNEEARRYDQVHLLLLLLTRSRANLGGFTAINSSSPAPAAHSSVRESPLAAREIASREQSVTVASTYLGTCEKDPSSASTNPVGKKTTAKGKKRTTTAPNTMSAKRRKTSHVTGALPTAKPRATRKERSTAKSKAKIEDHAGEAALQHEHADLRSTTEHGTVGEADSTSASMLVSVIAPSTSMSALHNTSQQASFDAAKSSSHGRMTLYSSSFSPTKCQSIAKAGQAKMAHTPCSPAQIIALNSNSRLPDDPRHSVQHGADDDDDDFGALFDELAQQIENDAAHNSMAPGKNDQRTARSATTECPEQLTFALTKAPGGEDDLLEDDFDEELLEATTKAERASKVSTTLRAKGCIKEQLPTPAQSDVAEHYVEAAVGVPMPDVDDDPDEGLMIPRDDEDENLIELGKAIQEAGKTGLESRSHKQNVRVVDGHEDDGRALLDDAEKQLLSKHDDGLDQPASSIMPRACILTPRLR